MKKYFAITTLLFFVIVLSTRLFPIKYEMKIFIFGFIVFASPIFYPVVTLIWKRLWKR